MHIYAWVALGAVMISLAPARAADAVDVRGAPRTYKIGSSTQILLDGEEVKPDQLKVGLHATVVADSFQDGYAASIEAHTISAKGGATIDGGAKAPPAPVKEGDRMVQKPPAPQPVVSSLAGPASKAKYWTITAVGADSVTISYK